MKKILTSLFLVLSIACFSQSGTDNYYSGDWTPMAAKGYKFKYLRSDSGASIRAKLFVYDSTFLKGRAYANVLPATSDSSSQIANTEWVKKVIKDLGIYNIESDHVSGQSESCIYIDSVAAHTYRIRIDSACFKTTYGITLSKRSDSVFVTQHGVETFAFLDASGGGGSQDFESVLTEGSDLTTDHTVSITPGKIFTIATTNYNDTRQPSVSIDSTGVFFDVTGPVGSDTYLAVVDGNVEIRSNSNRQIRVKQDSVYVDIPNHSSDTSKYKPLGRSTSGGIVTMDNWPTGGGAGTAPKKYVALLTQAGTDDPQDITSGPLTVGVTYQITTYNSGDDFTNVGAPSNTNGIYFVATATTPTNWTHASHLGYNTAAPVAVVLENTIGNVYWRYMGTGSYNATSDGLFTTDKTYTITQNPYDAGNAVFAIFSELTYASDTNDRVFYLLEGGTVLDDLLKKTMVTIIVYE